MKILSSVLIAVLFLKVLSGAYGAEVPQELLERSETTKNVRIEWSSTRKYYKGSFGKAVGDNGETVPLPAKDTEAVVSYTLSMSPQKLIYERTGKKWHRGAKSLQDDSYQSLFDGEASTSAFGATETVPVNTGTISKKNGVFGETGNYHVDPVIFAFRPLDKRYGGIDDAKCLVSEAIYEGKPCVLITDRRSDKVVRKYWIDTSRGSQIVRIQKTIDGEVSEKTNIKLKEYEEFGYLPESWAFYAANPKTGEVFESHRSQVSKIEFDPAFSNDTFKIAFKPGTVIWDDQVEKGGTVDENGKIVYEEEVDGTEGLAVESKTILGRFGIYFTLSAILMILYVRLKKGKKD